VVSPLTETTSPPRTPEERAAVPPYGSVAHVRAVLEQVVDPEIPVQTIADRCCATWRRRRAVT